MISSDVQSSALLPPLVVLAAHVAVGKKRAKAQFAKIYKTAEGHLAASYNLHLSKAGELGLLDANGPTDSGIKLVSQWVPKAVESRPLPAQKFLQVFSAAYLLRTPATEGVLKQLGDPMAVLVGLVTLAVAPHRFPGLQKTARATRDRCVQAIIEQKLVDAFPGISLENVSTTSKSIDPSLAAVFRHAMVSTDVKIEDSFRTGFETIFKTRLTGAPSTWWGPILASAARDDMPTIETSSRVANDFVSILLNSTRVAAAEATSGWLTIADAYQKFQSARRLTLGDFKRQLVEAALEGQVELSPLNVSSSLPSPVREQSETEFGGRTYHFLRITRRRSVA